MSLVICSNKNENGLEYDRNFKGQSPFSFTNHMTQTIELPPNTEVAVQSVKINKDGLIRVSPSDRWYMYLNRNVRLDTDITNVLDSTGMPIISSPNVVADQYVNIDEFRRLLEEGFQQGLPTPAYFNNGLSKTTLQILRGTTGSPSVTGTGFQGFRITIGEQPATVANKFTANAIDYNYTPRTPDASPVNITTTNDGSVPPVINGVKFQSIKSIAIADEANLQSIWANKHPLCRKGGVMVWDLTGLHKNNGAGDYSFNNNLKIGLCRGTGKANGQIEYKNNVSNDFSQISNITYDYVVECGQTDNGSNRWLKVGHYVKDPTDVLPNAPCCMREIIYFKGNNGIPDTFADSVFNTISVQGQGRYNMSTNANHFSELRFTCNNEVVEIALYSLITAQWVILSSWDQREGGVLTQTAKALKNVPKPANQNCWALYPKLVLFDSTKFAKLITYHGVDMGVGLTSSSINTSWYERMRVEGTISNCIDLDTRWYNNELSTEFYPCLKTTGTGTTTMLDYKKIIILVPDTTHYEGTEGANIQYKLGFTARAILDETAQVSPPGDAQLAVYDSDNVPLLKANSSLFVRLDNMTQKTFNAGTGRISKILYHMPRFDQSNREIGTGLYFEPGERVYVKCLNSESIFLNELSLSISDDKEILVDDLTGETIIILHFRQSNTPLYRGGRKILLPQ